MKHWPLRKTYYWERAPFARLLLPLVAGIFTYCSFDAAGPYLPVIMPVAGMAGLVLQYIFNFRSTTRINNRLSFVLVHTTLFCLGWLCAYTADIRNHPHWFGHHTGKADGWLARITDRPEEKEKTWKLEVEVINVVENGKAKPTHGNAFVYVHKYDAPALREGDILVLPDNFQRIVNRGNPYEFDYAKYSTYQGIYYQQFLAGKDIGFYQYSKDNTLPWIKRLHYWCLWQIEWYVPDRDVQGFLKAMLLDEKSMLDERLQDAYAATGIVHIIAISGGHIGIFFALTALLFLWLRHRRYRWVRYIAALPLVWTYVLVAGAPASAVRAAMMFSILGVGLALSKNPNPVNQLLATAFLLLCVQPYWLFDVGFQLSFIAVLSIFLFYRPILQWIPAPNKLFRMLWQAVAVSLAAEVLVAPLVVYYFHLFPLQFLVANLLAWLFMGVVLVLTLLLLVVSPFYSVAQFTGDVITGLCSGFNQVVYSLQGWNIRAFNELTLVAWEVWTVYLLIVLLAVFFVRKYKPAFFAAGFCICLLVFANVFEHYRQLRQVSFIWYNSGSKDGAELIRGREATILCGDTSDKAWMVHTLKPVHIHHGVQDLVIPGVDYNLLKMGNKKVFILRGKAGDTALPVDYVVLKDMRKMPGITQIIAHHHPEKIIVAGTVARQLVPAIRQQAAQEGIAVHAVAKDGAFILGR